MKLAIGVDIGGTNIVCGAVDSNGRVERKIKRPTGAREGEEAILARIANMIGEIRDAMGWEHEIEAVGVGVPGLVDVREGISRASANLKWQNVPVAAPLERKLGLPVFIDNDVRMYVYGEAMAGAGRGYGEVYGITVGTGIAAALVQDGKLFYGFKGMAGEIGHIRMEGVDEPCACGLRGCLEAVASASGMARQAIRAVRAGRRSVLADWFPGDTVERLTSADLSRAMDAGDELATEVVTRAGTLCGDALATAVMLFSPQMIVVGGGGALAGERLLEPLRKRLNERILSDFAQDLRVEPAQNNDDAGIIGSALYARNRLAEQFN